MKKERFDFIAMFISIFLLSAFIIIHKTGGALVGSVSSVNNAQRVWAIKGGDTVKVAITEGQFSITDLKPGNYTVLIEALPPFQHKSVSNVKIKDGLTTNVGTLTLEHR